MVKGVQFELAILAKYILDEYKKISGTPIDEMKLHKLLYFTQRESLAITGEAMFVETFEGWKFGPVSRLVRDHFDGDDISVSDMYYDEFEDAEELV